MKRYFILTFIIIVAGVNFLNAQDNVGDFYRPKFALKTNALYLATTTFNLGAEIGLAKKWTLEIAGNYNPWQFSDYKKIKHWLVQPELRLWTCERFSGHFFGLHGHYAEYNVGGFEFLDLEHKRFEGNLWGAGISYGYQWIIGNRWNIEATLGVGYARLNYDEYDCRVCGVKVKDDYKKNYWGPTKVGLSFVYFIK